MSHEVEVGQVLAGKYRVERVLGQGGMGVVVAAMHLQLGQLVALKFLLPHMCQHPEAVARFSREARAAVQIHSEHVARVTDVGTLESGAPYMVMEYLHGSDLGEVLHARGPLPIPEAIGLLLQACEAIAEAHSLGIVHRDLKPANLFLTQRRDGSALVKVLDFGISKALQEASAAPSMTQTSTIMGSPLYMSPEQVRSSKSVDARSDVWALGVILQELLTGAPTYEADTASALMAMIAADPPTPLRVKRPDAHAELESAILRCLEKDRDRRTQSVAEFARSIAPFAGPEAFASVERIARVLGESAPRSSMPAPSTARPSLVERDARATSEAWGQTQSHPRRNLRAWIVAALVLAISAAGVTGFFFWRARAAVSAAPEAPAAAAAGERKETPVPLAVPAAVTPSAEPSSAVVSPLSSAAADPENRLTHAPAQPSAQPKRSNIPVRSQAKPSSNSVRAEPQKPTTRPDLFDDNK
ncbi:MAG TPA: serine/threonine-protein kinase [Polyangiaceae bacterium]|jgi:serine/threonine protein kinase|nr:serine/threonine-protein kinase [Polyangiaceae bacterium]